MILVVSILFGKCQLKLKNKTSSDITKFTCILILYGWSRKNLWDL